MSPWFSGEETEEWGSKVTQPARAWLGFEARKYGAGVEFIITMPSCFFCRKTPCNSHAYLSGLVGIELTSYSNPGLWQCNILPLNGAFWGSGLDPAAHKMTRGKGRSWCLLGAPLDIRTCDFVSLLSDGLRGRVGPGREEEVTGGGTSQDPQTSSAPIFPNSSSQIWLFSPFTTSPILWVTLEDSQTEGAEGHGGGRWRERGRRMQRSWCPLGLLEVGESDAQAGSLGTVAYTLTIIALRNDHSSLLIHLPAASLLQPFKSIITSLLSSHFKPSRGSPSHLAYKFFSLLGFQGLMAHSSSPTSSPTSPLYILYSSHTGSC